MDKTVFEKLEITPGPWEASEHGDYGDFGGEARVILGDDMRIAAVHDGGIDDGNVGLIAAAPEMLEALIQLCLSEEFAYYSSGEELYDERFADDYGHLVVIIEKATGKTWEEVKALVDA